MENFRMESFVMGYLIGTALKEEFVSLANEYKEVKLGSNNLNERQQIEKKAWQLFENKELVTNFAHFVIEQNDYHTISKNMYALLSSRLPTGSHESFGILFSLFMSEVAKSIEDEKKRFFFLASIALSNQSMFHWTVSSYFKFKRFIMEIDKDTRQSYALEFEQQNNVSLSTTL